MYPQTNVFPDLIRESIKASSALTKLSHAIALAAVDMKLYTAMLKKQKMRKFKRRSNGKVLLVN